MNYFPEQCQKFREESDLVWVVEEGRIHEVFNLFFRRGYEGAALKELETCKMSGWEFTILKETSAAKW